LNAGEWPAGGELVVQSTVPEAPTAGWEQDQLPGDDTDWKVVPEGSGSSIATLDAVSGPWLVTTIEYVMVLPGATGSGESDLETSRSAVLVAFTLVVVVGALSLVSGSGVFDDWTAAVFEMVDPLGVLDFTVTTSEKLSVSPDAIEDVVQLTTPVVPGLGWAHVHPDGAPMDENVVELGSESRTWTGEAESGPWFVALIV